MIFLIILGGHRRPIDERRQAIAAAVAATVAHSDVIAVATATHGHAIAAIRRAHKQFDAFVSRISRESRDTLIYTYNHQLDHNLSHTLMSRYNFFQLMRLTGLYREYAADVLLYHVDLGIKTKIVHAMESPMRCSA